MPRNKMPGMEALKFVSLFQTLTDEQYLHLCTVMEYQNFSTGEFVAKQGQRSDAVFFLAQGTMKVSSIVAAPLPHSGRKEMILRVLGKGSIIGELHMVDGEGHTADVVALEKSICFKLETEHFRRLLKDHAPLQSALMRHVAFYTRYASARHEIVSLHNVIGSVAAQLVLLADELGEPQPNGYVLLPVPLTQSLLAGLTGHSRESINKTIKRFQNCGWIVPQPRYRMLIQDLASLRRAYLTALPHFST